jgi:benzoate membrane transport protein
LIQSQLRQLLRDLSLPAFTAGFVAVLVGFTSSVAIVFQAAQSLGATQAQTSSWMWALGLGMGVTSLLLSWRYKQPILTAWSTPGAALIATSAGSVTLPEATGAFLLCGFLIALVGFSKIFEKLMSKVPMPLASALLAGVLVKFCLQAFVALQSQTILVLGVMLTYLVGRRFFPRYCVPAALAVGIAFTLFLKLAAPLSLNAWNGISLAMPVLVVPEFSWTAILGIGLPLFIVTMASQNMPGVATLRACGYNAPISPVIGWTGIATMVLAPFGGYALNLAAITAAICMSNQADENPARRYTAAMSAGLMYCLVGLMGGAVALALSWFPKELVMVIAGLALLPTVTAGITSAVVDEKWRDAAIVTFLVTASGVTLLGIGSALWGLLSGLIVLAALMPSRRQRNSR